jgi:hypothetical protein
MMIGQAPVSVTPDGRLIAPGDGGPAAWTPAGAAGQFRAVNGPDTMLIAKAPDGATRLYMSNGVISYDRIGPLYQRSVLMFLAGLALVAALATLIGPAVRFQRGLRQTGAQRALSNLQLDAAALWTLTCLALGSFAMTAANQAEVLYSWPTPALLIASTAALLAAIFSAVALVALPFAWRAGSGEGWSLWRKLRSSVTSLIFAALAIQLGLWGLLQPWAT